MIDALKHNLMEGRIFMGFAALRAAGHVLMALVPIIIARFFTPEIFGIYSLSIMIVYFFTALLISSSNAPFVIYARQELRESGKINKAFTARMLFLASAVIMFFILSMLLLHPLTRFASITKGQFMFLFAAYAGLGIKYSFETMLLALNKRTAHALFGLATGITSVLYIVLAYFLSALTLENIFLMFFISPLLAMPFFITRIDVTKIFPMALDRELLKNMLRYTRWVMLGGTAVYFINWGDNLVLRYFVSLEEVGMYNLGYQVFKGMIMLVGSIKLYFLPFIAEHIENQHKIRNYLYHKRPRIMLLGALGIVALFFSLPSIFTALYGNSYRESALVAQILTIPLIFILYQSFYMPLFETMKKFKFIQSMNVLLVTVNIALDIILVMYVGVLGAAIATAITYILSGVLYEIYFIKYVHRNLVGDSFPTR